MWVKMLHNRYNMKVWRNTKAQSYLYIITPPNSLHCTVPFLLFMHISFEFKYCSNQTCPPHAFIPYPTAFPYGNGMVLHFYQQQESSTTKTVHKVINKGLKAYV